MKSEPSKLADIMRNVTNLLSIFMAQEHPKFYFCPS